jgi:rhamnosyl/mannosyltransferase
MHVLHAYKVHALEQAGGIPHTVSLLASKGGGGETVSVVTARKRGGSRSLVVEGVPVRQAASGGNLCSMPVAPTYPFILAREARQAGLVVHHAPFPLNDLALAFGLPDCVALVVHWHADVIGRPILAQVLAPLMRRSLRRADQIVVADHRMILHSPMLRPHAHKCVVVPYGTNLDYWQDGGSVAAEVAALRARHPRMILAVGRLVPYKGFDVLVEAMQRLDATVVIVGEGPEREHLWRQANRLGVADRLLLLGHCAKETLKAHLHAARVFAFPSVTAAESFGIAQLEAMAVGLPIVNTQLETTVPHVARHGREALTVRPGDADALADALQKLLSDPALSGRLGDAARDRVRTHYSNATFLHRTADVYAAAIRRRGAADAWTATRELAPSR